VEKVVDKAGAYPNHVIEGILGVAVAILEKFYRWSLMKKVTRQLCSWPLQYRKI
jgi:hypothetical protein